jgi:hypothetical protein
VIATVEPELTGREVDNGDAAAWLHAPHDVTREGGAVGDVVQHRSHIDRTAAVVWQFRGVRRSLNDSDIRDMRAVGGVGDRAAAVWIQFGRKDFPTLTEKLRDSDGVRPVAGADVSDAIAWSNPECLDKPRRLTRPSKGQDKECEMRSDGN